MFTINHPTKYSRTKKNRRGKPIRQRKAKKLGAALVEALYVSWKDFCTTSSFVGLRYVYRKNHTIFDVVFWSILIPILMYCSISFVGVFLDRYHSMSTTTVVQSQHYLTSRSVFPGFELVVHLILLIIKNRSPVAVTACLSSRIRKSKVNAFIDEYINSNDYLKASVNLTHFVKIFDLGQNADFITLSNAGRVFSAYNMTMRDVLDWTTEDCEEVLTVCRFAGQPTPCSKIFKRTMAVGGFCCSFNYPMSLDDIKQGKWLRISTFGQKGGLSFAFKTFPHDDYYFKVDYGITLRVLLHSPRTFPTFNQNDFFMPHSMETAIEIFSVVNTADEKVRSLAVEDRDCLFSFEKSLTRFKTYSNSNCLLQCGIDRVLNNCGCVTYYYPSNDSEICSTEQYHCSYRSRRVGAKQGDKTIYTQFSDCDCPDDCGVVKHYAKINSWNLTTTATRYSVDEFYDKVKDGEGIVHIYYGKSITMRLKRKLSLDEIELASNIGGIVAIFLGCSFLSVIECVYFFTIRILKYYKCKVNVDVNVQHS